MSLLRSQVPPEVLTAFDAAGHLDERVARLRNLVVAARDELPAAVYAPLAQRFNAAIAQARGIRSEFDVLVDAFPADSPAPEVVARYTAAAASLEAMGTSVRSVTSELEQTVAESRTPTAPNDGAPAAPAALVEAPDLERMTADLQRVRAAGAEAVAAWNSLPSRVDAATLAPFTEHLPRAGAAFTRANDVLLRLSSDDAAISAGSRALGEIARDLAEADELIGEVLRFASTSAAVHNGSRPSRAVSDLEDAGR